MENKVARLRNLMTPIVNYFAILKDQEMSSKIQKILDKNDDEMSSKLIKILDKEAKKSIENLSEIKDILYQIPDDAIKEENKKK